MGTSMRRRNMALHLMLLPAVLIAIVYNYLPILGNIIAFMDLNVGNILASKFVGLENFRYAIAMPDTFQVLYNTVFISLIKIIAKIIFPLMFALLLNEISSTWFKKTVQTVTYLPFLISWVALGAIFLDFFSQTDGVVNELLSFVGIQAIPFFGNAHLFPAMVVLTDLWKEIGFNTIVILAAITGIDPTLYEASFVDGAGKWKQTLHISLPSLLPIVVMLTLLSMGNILNAGFDQIFNLYNPIVYPTGDIIDTFVYRLGLEQAQYSLATAIGVFKSVVSFGLILSCNWLANRFTGKTFF